MSEDPRAIKRLIREVFPYQVHGDRFDLLFTRGEYAEYQRAKRREQGIKTPPRLHPRPGPQCRIPRSD